MPCGCQKCGCMCAEHAPAGQRTPCWLHADAGPVPALCALALFIGNVILWAAIFQS